MTSPMQYNGNKPEEDVIAIMGMTGSGKSTFLNLVCGGNQFRVGHDLNSETAVIQEFQFPYKDAFGHKRLLCFLDTPGFGDTYKLDSETLGVISAGLLARPNITGIIYFHNINEPRMTHLAYQATEIFYDICGGEAMKNVILCTSQWDKLMDKSEGKRRESQLRGEYWKKMIEDGARTVVHNNTAESAGQILKRVILGKNPVTPKLVEELRRPGATLERTSAGRVISDFNKEKVAEIEHKMAEMKKFFEVVQIRIQNDLLEAKRAPDEGRRARRETDIAVKYNEVMEPLTAARNEAERLLAEWDRRDAKLKERKAWLRKLRGSIRSQTETKGLSC